MAASTTATAGTSATTPAAVQFSLRRIPARSAAVHFSSCSPSSAPSLRSLSFPHRRRQTHLVLSSPSHDIGNGDGSGGSDGDGGDGADTGGGGGGGDEDAREHNRLEAILALGELGRTMDSLPPDLAAAVKAGRIPGEIVRRFAELEKTPGLGWLLRVGGFKERLLADDLFLTKVAIECGVGIFTKSAAEWERRRENFTKELDFVLADVVMAFVADFMLVWLPAPTVPLRPSFAVSAGPISNFFYNCPHNAFQVAFAGTHYSLLQRLGAILLNGAKLFLVGSCASLVGTGLTNGLINIRKAVDQAFAGEAENVPIVSTSVAYGVYMSVSSNLRYQLLAGVIEQRILEPLLHQQKLILSALCFAVRTGNTFLGSLLYQLYDKLPLNRWVDYVRWVGIQKARQ